MLIRAAGENDVPALMTLLRRSWLTTWAPELDFATVQRFAATDNAGNYVRAKWREFIVASSDQGTLLGVLHVENNHLHAIHLDPKYKRCGIGSLLMDKTESHVAKNYPTAKLEVLAFNTGAIAFYEKRGWRKSAAIQIDECGQMVDAYEMIKTFEK